jgi:hypothetical protein
MSAPQEGVPKTAAGKATDERLELLAGETAELQHPDNSPPRGAAPRSGTPPPRGAVAPRSGATASADPAAQASSLGDAGRTLHVRHIGVGGCKSEMLLRKVFAVS